MAGQRNITDILKEIIINKPWRFKFLIKGQLKQNYFQYIIDKMSIYFVNQKLLNTIDLPKKIYLYLKLQTKVKL